MAPGQPTVQIPQVPAVVVSQHDLGSLASTNVVSTGVAPHVVSEAVSQIRPAPLERVEPAPAFVPVVSSAPSSSVRGRLKPSQGGMPSAPAAASPQPNFGWTLEKEEVLRQARGLPLLSLYHGPLGSEDGLDHYVGLWGATLAAYDLEVSLLHDLAANAVWTAIKADIEEGIYASLGKAMPCGTFSAARSFEDGGPRPLRG